MFTQLSINGNPHYIALADTGQYPGSIIRRLASGRVVELSQAPVDLETGLEQQPVDLAQIAAELRDLIKTVSAQFVGRDELTTAFVTAAIAGESTFVYGPPGTAKTAVASALVEAINGSLWRTLLNPDITRDDIYGAIDPMALKAGQWTRNWSSFATADVAILDEIWKASPQVNNIFLDGLEERKVRAGDTEKRIPLVTALAMSNEIPDDSERQAVYDRFLVRLTVTYMRDPGDFETMLTASAGACHLTSNVTTDHLRLMAGAAELLAMFPPADLMDTLKDLWREIGQNGRSVSDRRWRKTLKLACANALLNGETPGAHHLDVARWTLWTDLDDEPEIRNLVLSKTDPVAGSVLDCEALMADLNKAAAGLNRQDVTSRASVAGKGRRLIKQVDAVLATNGAGKYASRLEAIKTQAGLLVDTVLESM
jgi:MoxR-like ATPase